MAICGYQTGLLLDASRSNWQNTGERPIAWSAWYPTDETERVDTSLGHFFEPGDVIRNASVINGRKLPVVLLSHGTGGTAESVGWLAQPLACEGYVVIGANHHGNTGLEPYLAEGFLCWWERGTDLSVLLASLATTGAFADTLDLDRVSAVGFSLGGYTVMALAGAQTSLEEFDIWRKANSVTDGGPKEFPAAADQIPTLLDTSEAFRHSWARHGDDFTDDRIASLIAIAPAPPIRSFTSQSLARLKLPVTILTGGADLEAPSEQCADWLVKQNKDFQHHDLGRKVGHYTFLDVPSDTSLVGTVDIFTDHESIDREDVHKRATKLVLQALK